MKLLSILICTIPSRIRHLSQLLALLSKQVTDEIEILYLGDFKSMTVGMKMRKLLHVSSGKYICFVDDDDYVTNDYVESILHAIKENPDVDCICFDVKIFRNNKPDMKVVYSTKFKKDGKNKHFYERLPNHLMVIKREIAEKEEFADITFGADAQWAKDIKPHLKTEARIDKVLYYYFADDTVTESRNK